MSSQVIDGQVVNKKLKTRYPDIEFDKLQMYFGNPYVINTESSKGIIIYQPTIGKIVEFGEKKFYETLNIFITNTTSHRLLLWNNGIDWCETSDFELFCMLYKQINHEASSLIFNDLDFSKFQICKRDDKYILYDYENDIEINEDVYQHIAQYLRNVFQIFPEEKITTSKMMKEMFIRKDERELKNKEYKKEKSSSIQSLISSCVNHPGFKYKLKELKDMGICEFYDSVKRLQIYESTTALMKGMYSGFVDTSHINSDAYNFMKDIEA